MYFTHRKAAADPVVVDVPKLRAALVALAQHRTLLQHALRDLGLGPEAIDELRAALGHVVHDEYRSPSTRGGS